MRCFIIGNGPSLAHTPLDRLQDDITIAVNNVHLIYPSTDWRPTIYVRAEQGDTLEPEHWKTSIQTQMDGVAEIWCNDYFLRPRFGIENVRPVKVIKSCAHYLRHFDSPDCPHMLHMPILCTFGSSVNVAIQIAMMKELSPIYLVGCDLGYKDGQHNHFTKDYEHGREQPSRYANLDTLAAHMIAARSGYEIHNATLGGELEVYPRVDLEAIL